MQYAQGSVFHAIHGITGVLLGKDIEMQFGCTCVSPTHWPPTVFYLSNTEGLSSSPTRGIDTCVILATGCSLYGRGVGIRVPVG
jgi:hypothetical protein